MFCRFLAERSHFMALDYSIFDLEELAKENISQRITISVVQPKLLFGFTNQKDNKIVGALNGRYILKPPYVKYPQMTEIETI